MKPTCAVVYIVTKLELASAPKACLLLMKNLATQDQFKTILISGTHGPLVAWALQSDEVFLLSALRPGVSLYGFFRDCWALGKLVWRLAMLRRLYGRLIVHTFGTKAGFLGRIAAFLTGSARTVHTVHGFGFNHLQTTVTWWAQYLAEYFLSKITDSYVCTSQNVYQHGLALIPFFAKKGLVIRSPVEWKKFFIPARSPQVTTEHSAQVRLVSVGSFNVQTNMIDVLIAFAQVHKEHKETSLELVGDGPLREQLEQFVVANGLEGAVTFHGWQHDTKLILQQCSIFLQTSLREDLSNAVVEARLLGLPVLSYDLGAIKEVIHHNINGMLCAPGDIQTYSRFLRRLVTDSTYRAALAHHPENLEDFSDVVSVREHIELYRS